MSVRTCICTCTVGMSLHYINYLTLCVLHVHVPHCNVDIAQSQHELIGPLGLTINHSFCLQAY